MAKTIKISESNYRMLNNYAGMLRSRFGRPISFDYVLATLLKKRKSNILNFAGSWEMSDKEFEKIKSSLDEMWKGWELK